MKKPFGVNDQTFFYGAYGLLCATIWFGSELFAVTGAILVYVYRQQFIGTIYQDHTSYVIRTVIGYLLLSIFTLVTAIIGLGGIVYLIAIVWFIFRTIYGLVKVWKEQAVTPTGWLI